MSLGITEAVFLGRVIPRGLTGRLDLWGVRFHVCKMRD